MGRALALDLGEKRIGLAISDLTGLIAQPFKTLSWGGIKHLISELRTIIPEQQVDRIVVGVPYTLKGTNSKKTDEVLAIIKKLRNALDIEVFEEDERLTSVMAQQSLHAMGKNAKQQRQIIDQLAAVYILQSWLDRN